MPDSSILTKAFGLLDLITASDRPMTLNEIAERCGLPRSSTHRLLVLLRDSHALRVDDGTYRPGARLMRWGVLTQQRDRLAETAAPHMTALCRETGLRIALSVPDTDAVLYVHTVEYGDPFRLAPRVGQHSPLHASAAGKVLLAALPDAERSALLLRLGYEKCTEFTLTSQTELETEIRAVQDQGYGMSLREELRQTSGLAVPVPGPDGGTIAALSLWTVGDEELKDRLVSALGAARDAARAISEALGYRGSPPGG